jgi:flagellin-like hook-associated protein FlgL
MMHSEEVINKKSQQISSGKRIGIPSDDPIGTSRAMNYRTSLTEVAQYITNSNLAKSWLDITDDSLQTVSKYLDRVRVLVTEGANSTTPDEGWEAMALEIEQIRDGIVQVTNTTMDNRYIFGGEKVSEKPYEYRNSVSSDAFNWVTPPAPFAAGVNDQFSISVDGNAPITITMPVTGITYDNSGSGRTLDDLAEAIQTQINLTMPANVPVNVKATPDGRLSFYAGTQPPNGTHSLVMREVAGNTGLATLNFQDQATTKELTGAALTTPIPIVAKYPIANSITGFAGGNIITLDPNDAAGPNYYDNWTLMTDDGTNVTTQPVTASGLGTVTFATMLPASANLKYYLSPPLTGTSPGATGVPNTMNLAANSSTFPGFYVGMSITITGGTGLGQTRTITGYTGPPLYQITVDPSQPFVPSPDNSSLYSIDASSYVNANNKFKITIGNEPTQEISMDGGAYSMDALAQMLQTKIQERGIPYDSIQVSVTPDNQLRIIPTDAANNPLPIKLESGSTADGLWLLGFKNGAVSDEPVPNYEGNHGTMNYEINVGIKLSANSIGDTIFDPIFRNLAKICMDLRAGNTTALSADIGLVKQNTQDVVLTLSEVGAKTNRIEKGLDRLKTFDQNYNKLLSDVEDTDVSKAIIDLTSQQTTYQAALQMAAKILPMTLLDFLK